MDEIDYGAAFGIEEPETTIGRRRDGARRTVWRPAQQSPPRKAKKRRRPPPLPETIQRQRPKKERARQKRIPSMLPPTQGGGRLPDAAIAKAKADAQAEAQKTIDQFFRNSGLVNPLYQGTHHHKG